MLTDTDGLLVTAIELTTDKPEKVNYPRPGFSQNVIYTVGEKKIPTTLFSEKRKNIAQRFENTQARIAKQNLRVKLNEAGKIESEITMFF